MFGEGTYLSSELSVCLHYSPNGTGWDHSVVGKQLSCVAVCEIIDDPSVKCKTHGMFPLRCLPMFVLHLLIIRVLTMFLLS